MVSNPSNWSVTDNVHSLCNVRDLAAPIAVQMRGGDLLWADQAGDIVLRGWALGNRAALTVKGVLLVKGKCGSTLGLGHLLQQGGHMSWQLGGAHLKSKEGDVYFSLWHWKGLNIVSSQPDLSTNPVCLPACLLLLLLLLPLSYAPQEVKLRLLLSWVQKAVSDLIPVPRRGRWPSTSVLAQVRWGMWG